MSMDERTPFRDILRRYRTAAGLTQETLAERANLSVRGLSDLERGVRRLPRADTITLLADALKLDEAERDAFAAAAARRPPAPWSDLAPGLTAAARDTYPATLPTPPTPLVGRERDVSTVAGQLLRHDRRLLTLMGPGGVGKTRLAVGIAVDLYDHFADGVFFVSLAPIRDAALVAPTIARTLNLRDGDRRAAIDRVTQRLRNKHVLLILDNFEQVASAAPVVADLLAACPGLTALVTSRAALRIRGEHEYPVAPLDLPDLADLPPVEAMAQYPAVMLFDQRARAVKPDWRLTPANAPTVAAICWRLDGLPLAIELAAARVKLLPPHALLARLDRAHDQTSVRAYGHTPLQLLTGGARDLPERQQTMRATIAWSYDLLAQGEQTLLRRLSVFVRGATIDAVEAIVASAPPDDVSIVDRLTALLDKSLLRRNEGADEETRVWMLGMVRAYGWEQLAVAGEAEETRERHAAYYLTLAEEAEPELLGAGQTLWLARLEQEHHNLRAALRWYLKRGDGARGLRLGGALWRFWYVRSYFTEGRDWLTQLLALPSAGQAGQEEARAKALNGAGNLAYNQGDVLTARRLHEESLAIRRAIGDRQGVAGSLNNLALIARGHGDYVDARLRIDEAIAINQELGNRDWEAINLSNLGSVKHHEGDYAAAHTLYARSLDIFMDIGDDWGHAMALCDLGNVAGAPGG